jgi:transposase
MKRPRYLTPPEIATRFQISVDKVHNWIKTGQLRACNLATKATGRPRYSIDERDLETFIASRAVSPQSKIIRTSRKRPKCDVVEFF